jgi:mono/diheme cytochrome c family protein
LLSCLAHAGYLGAQPPPEKEISRGELLYSTHCIACHTSQVHWRDKRLATDWKSLVEQVRRWQGNTGLQWSGEDINSVAHYLNSLYYRFPASEGKAAADELDRAPAHR